MKKKDRKLGGRRKGKIQGREGRMGASAGLRRLMAQDPVLSACFFLSAIGNYLTSPTAHLLGFPIRSLPKCVSPDRVDLGWQFTGGEKWHWIASAVPSHAFVYGNPRQLGLCALLSSSRNENPKAGREELVGTQLVCSSGLRGLPED